MARLCNLHQPSRRFSKQTQLAFSAFDARFHGGIYHLALIFLKNELIHFFFFLRHFGVAVQQSISSHYDLYGPNYRQQEDVQNVLCIIAETSSDITRTIKKCNYMTMRGRKRFSIQSPKRRRTVGRKKNNNLSINPRHCTAVSLFGLYFTLKSEKWRERKLNLRN